MQGEPWAFRCPLELSTPLCTPEALPFHPLVPERRQMRLWSALGRAECECLRMRTVEGRISGTAEPCAKKGPGPKAERLADEQMRNLG